MTVSSDNQSRKKRARLAVTWVVLLAFALSLIVPFAAARAATIPGAITDISITDNNGGDEVYQYQEVNVRANWAVPNGTQPGDTFRMTLPPQLAGLQSTFDLANEAGIVFGSCTVSQTEVLCTLSDEVANYNDVSGELWFTGRITTETTQGEINEFVFETDGQTQTVDVPVMPGSPFPGFPDFRKYGENIDGMIRWRIEIPFTSPDGLTRNLTNVVITDTLGPDQDFVGLDDVRFLVADELIANGTWPDFRPAEQMGVPYSKDITGNTATIRIPELTAGRYYVVEIMSRPVPGSQPPYFNSATFEADEVEGREIVDVEYDFNAGGNGDGNKPTPTPTPSETVTPTPTPSETATPTPTPSETVTPTPTPSETATPTPSPTPSETVTPTPTPSETATPSPTPTPSETATPTPSETATPTPTPTETVPPTCVPSPSPSTSPSPSPSATDPSPSSTPTPSGSPSATSPSNPPETTPPGEVCTPTPSETGTPSGSNPPTEPGTPSQPGTPSNPGDELPETGASASTPLLLAGAVFALIFGGALIRAQQLRRNH